MTPGDLFLAYFPFGGSAGMKLRPVLLLTPPVGAVPEILAAYISSAPPPDAMSSDLVLDPALPEYSSTGLKAKSFLRLHKLATLHRRSMARRLGAVSPVVWKEVQQKLRAFLSL